MNDAIKLVEVGPRDGLQNESTFIPTDAKLQLIEDLSSTGLKTIEVTSFVSKSKIPQLADAEELVPILPKKIGVHYPVLVPNLKGFDEAIAAGAQAVSLFTSASETFNQKNINCSIAESIERFQPIFDKARSMKIPVRAYLSCCLGCPYEGHVDYGNTAILANKLLHMGAYEISIGDTIGIGTPKQVKDLLNILLKQVEPEKTAMHFHNTYGQAIANIYESLSHGIRTFDSSIAGLGGCPYAQGATGNVATEDVIYHLHGLGFKTGVDLERLCKIGQDFCHKFRLKNQSYVSLANMDG